MTSALSMSNNQLQPTTSIKADLGGGGGLRGTTAVPSPLPAPSPPLMPSGAQGVSASTGGDAHRGGGLPGTCSSTPLTPTSTPTPSPTTPTPSPTPTPLTLPVPSPPLVPSVVQGGSTSTGGGALGGGDLPGSSSNLPSFLQPSFLDNCPSQLPSSPPPIRPPPPSSSSPLLPPTGDSKLGFPRESLLPLKGCPSPHFCVGGRNHVYFLPPGRRGDLPTREQVEWFTLR